MEIILAEGVIILPGRNIITAVIILLALSAGLCTSCTTIPESVSSEWTEAMFFKNAQEAMDNNNYELATYYYEVYSIRYPENIQKGIAAEYEKAFINYKRGRDKAARAGFEEILRKYRESPYAMLYPPRFQQLCETGLRNLEKRKKVGRRLFWRIREKEWADEHDEKMVDSEEKESS